MESESDGLLNMYLNIICHFLFKVPQSEQLYTLITAGLKTTQRLGQIWAEPTLGGFNLLVWLSIVDIVFYPKTLLQWLIYWVKETKKFR